MKLSEKYIDNLISGFYKCLCLFEENNEGLTRYIDSFSYEVYGLQYRVDEDKRNVIETLLNILEHFYDDSFEPEPNLEQIRRQTFHCTNLIKSTFKVGDD